MGICLHTSYDVQFLCHLKNYYAHLRARKIELEKLEGNAILKANGKRILWIQEPLKSRVNEEFDYVLVSNNVLKSIDGVFTKEIPLLVLDDSNSSFWIKRLKDQAPEKVYSLYEEGALRIIF